MHLTPRWILDALGEFDLDPCAADPRPWDCAKVNYTEADDGLSKPFIGRVWMNPPFHRYHIASWLISMSIHNHGIALVHARTETEWFEYIWNGASALLFLSGRVTFLKPDGSPQTITSPSSKHFGKVANSGAPVVLASFGCRDAEILESCGIRGHFVPLMDRAGNRIGREVVA